LTTSTSRRRYGRRPAQPGRPHLKLSRILHPELPPPPESVDALGELPDWGMLGNDRLGDCTCAGVAHLRLADCNIAGNPLPTITDADVVGFYEHFGYRPGDPDSDQGAVCQDVLAYWHRSGFLGERVGAYARVDLSDRREVMQAINLFGALYCGLTVTQATEDQTDAGQPWDYVPGSKELGGHCVIVGAYDADGLTAVTWGQRQRLTWTCWERQFDEAWVPINPDWINSASGMSHGGLNLAALQADYRALTGRPVAA
jgi:hypothetical protein